MTLNNRSCVLDAFAHVMRWAPKLLAVQVGHQGPEGYHTQELIEVALNNGWAVTPIERSPSARNPENYEIRTVRFHEGNNQRFIKQLMRQRGVLLGCTPITQKPHAVAWNSKSLTAYDASSGITFRVTEGREIKSTFFVPSIFLRMDRIGG